MSGGLHKGDVGCDISSSCLTCPLPECRYDNPVAYQAFKRDQEDPKREKVLTLLKKGTSVKTISKETGLDEKVIRKRGTRAGIRMKKQKVGRKPKGR